MLLDIIFTASCGGAGVCCGWVMHALHRAGAPSVRQLATLNNRSGDLATAQRSGNNSFSAVAAELTRPLSDAPISAPSTSVTDAVSTKTVAAVADRIRSFVSTIAANVDEHQSRIDAASDVLGASDLSAAPPEIIEAVGQLIAANEMMRTQLAESHEKLHEQTKQLQSAEQRAETDALTQVANRGAFNKRLGQQHAKGINGAGVMAILDIDFFKRFNDEHGHRVGDEVLRSVAQMLETRLQPYGLVARFGGEEFCAMIDNLDYDAAIDLIEQTRIAISNRELRFEGKRLKVTMSVGIGMLQPNHTADDWLQRVDEALYRSKAAGRNCAHYIVGDRFIRVGERSGAVRQVVDSPEAVLAETVLTEIQSTTHAMQTGVDAAIQRSEKITAEDAEAVQLAKIVAGLQHMQATVRPQALEYLPDREAMIEGITDAYTNSSGASQLTHLIAVSLSGQPSGAVMRSLLQVVRAAMRSQDRIGCLDQSTLLVCLSDCDIHEVLYRAEQFCAASASIGLCLASAEKMLSSKRLSVGIATLRVDHHGSAPEVVNWSAIDQMISHAQALAMLARRQPAGGDQAHLPIIARTIELAAAHQEASRSTR